MMLGKLFPKEFPGCGVEVINPKFLQEQKRRVELAYTDRFWPRHPYLRFFAIASIAMPFVFMALLIITADSHFFGASFGIAVLAVSCAVAAYPISRIIGVDTGIRWTMTPLTEYDRTRVPVQELERCVSIAAPDSHFLTSIYIERCSVSETDVAFILLYHKGLRLCFGFWGKTGENKLDREMRVLAVALQVKKEGIPAA